MLYANEAAVVVSNAAASANQQTQDMSPHMNVYMWCREVVQLWLISNMHPTDQFGIEGICFFLVVPKRFMCLYSHIDARSTNFATLNCHKTVSTIYFCQRF